MLKQSFYIFTISLYFCCWVYSTDFYNSKDLQILDNFKNGVFAQEKGDYKSALACFEKIAVEGQYFYPFVQLRIAQCKDSLGQIEEGIQTLEQLLAKGKRETAWYLPTRFYHAKFYEKQGNDTLAAENYKQVQPGIFLPWWMVSFLNDSGAFLIRTADSQKEGSACLQKVVNYGGYNLYRKNALLNLCLSTEDADRIFAIRYLLKSGYLSEAWFILANQVLPKCSVYLGPINLLKEWKIFEDVGKAFIEQVKQNKKSEYISLLFEYALRSLILSEKNSLADIIFAAMDYDFPVNFDAGDYLYWAGQKSEQRKEEKKVLFYYQTLLEHFPQHKKVPDTLFSLGFWFYQKGEVDRSKNYFIEIGDKYPQSSYFTRALYLSGSIFEKQGEKKRAKECYQKALQGKIGDYYVHRSADKLIKTFHDGSIKRKIVPLKHIPVSSLPFSSYIPNDEHTILQKIGEDVELKWLYYFSQLGVDEKEWIAYFICEQCNSGKRDKGTLTLLSHVGVAQVVWDYIYSDNSREMTNIKDEQKNQIFFPMPYHKFVVSWSKQMGVKPFLIWSIMKQESSYRTSVISTAGAKGLLQLIPSTAQWIAKKDNRLASVDTLLWKYPEYNIALGSAYFYYLLNRFQGNIVYAIAGYNAGPGNVDKWIGKKKYSDMDEFIENIPFTETRNYVKRVLGNYAAYLSIYDNF
ncbi:MAG TPA: transglycosylase SLT domain-containing protein [Candidatus Hydrogenedens sp.]|nr:transglycosylase SLT domain-containing protein [Candidatus Hydrogenedens sp.]